MNIKKAKSNLSVIEKRIASCNLRGFSTKKLMDARAFYISVIKEKDSD